MPFKEDVSVIIPTYNGAKKVISLLSNLSNQTFQNFRIYIGIDGSTDNTRAVLENQSYFNRERIYIYEQSNKGRSVIRNRAAEFASGNVLIFLDDDMEPEKKLIEKHYLHHFRLNESILGGNQIDRTRVSKSDYLIYKSFLSKKWMENYKNETQLLDETNLFVTAANFSISNSLFQTLNGFDERLTDAEDWDLSVRGFEKGFDIYFDKTIIAYHINPVTIREDITRQREYKKAHNLLKKSNPKLYSKKYDRIGIPNLDFRRKVIYWLLARKYNVFIVDNFNIYIFFPKKIRYIIYTIIRTGLGRIYINRKI